MAAWEESSGQSYMDGRRVSAELWSVHEHIDLPLCVTRNLRSYRVKFRVNL